MMFFADLICLGLYRFPQAGLLVVDGVHGVDGNRYRVRRRSMQNKPFCDYILTRRFLDGESAGVKVMGLSVSISVSTAGNNWMTLAIRADATDPLSM